MSAITTHILDTAQGRPAAGVEVTLERQQDGWRTLGRGVTNTDGRVGDLLPTSDPLESGTYRLLFAVAPYFAALGLESFYTTIPIVFEIRDSQQHHHVPLLLNPFGYSTYRGS